VADNTWRTVEPAAQSFNVTLVCDRCRDAHRVALARVGHLRSSRNVLAVVFTSGL